MKRYLNGEKVEDICRALSCSKRFLYRWRNRLNLADLHNRWEKERSRRPRTSPQKTPEAIEKHIERLYDERKHHGKQATAEAIRHSLDQQGITPAPSIRTIYRILSRHKRAPPQ